MFESGIDRISDNASHQTYRLIKNTVALEAALDKGIWKRPVLRLYYTYADWSDNAIGSVGTPYYANQSYGDNLGIQLEYWW